MKGKCVHMFAVLLSSTLDIASFRRRFSNFVKHPAHAHRTVPLATHQGGSVLPMRKQSSRMPSEQSPGAILLPSSRLPARLVALVPCRVGPRWIPTSSEWQWPLWMWSLEVKSPLVEKELRPRYYDEPAQTAHLPVRSSP